MAAICYIAILIVACLSAVMIGSTVLLSNDNTMVICYKPWYLLISYNKYHGITM